MKTFTLVTKSESGDDHIYYITNETKPTIKELKSFLLKNGNDNEHGISYETILLCKEVTNPLPLF